MRKAEVQMTLKKGADEGGGATPPSPIIPPKRSKASLAPDQAVPGQATPPVFARKMRNAAVGTGCDIRLKVSVTGEPQPSLYWYHNEDLLNMDNQEYGGLWIRDCKPSDAGLYTCIANNHQGEARSSAVLAVLDLGEDSETSEDEGEEYETKEDCGDYEFQPGPVLPPPSPRLIKRPSTSPMLGSRKKPVVGPTDYQDTVPGEFEEKVRQPKSAAMSQSSAQADSRPQTPVSEYSTRKDLTTTRPSPKLTKASSKVFEKVRGLEERRRSLDMPEGSVSGRSWAGFNRAASVDSDDGGSRLGISRESSREDLREALTEDAAERRSMFRQRAASLEDKPHYSQKVQDIENKFTQELERIKKLVGKPHLKKSFSTEQLTLRGKKSLQHQPLRKVEPIPAQVLQKLQERERTQWGKEQKDKGQQREGSSPPKSPSFTSQQPTQQQQQQQQPYTNTTPESMQLSDLPGQRSSVREKSRASPVREVIQRSPSPAKTLQQRAESPSRNIVDMTLRKVERRPPSPLVQRVSRIPQESPQHAHDSSPAPRPLPRDESSGRKTPIEVALRKLENRPESPLAQRKAAILQELPGGQPAAKAPPPPASSEEKTDVAGPPPKPASRLIIPTIIVEDESVVEEDVSVKTSQPQQTTAAGAKEAPKPKTKGKNRRTRPMSPEQDSSDDSYVSAGEDPMEAPVFEFQLQDTVAVAGTDVLLKCIIAGTPIPEVTWRKDSGEVTNGGNRVVKVEGELHTLLLRSATPGDGGRYSATAVNDVGQEASSATLIVKAEYAQEPRGHLVPRDISSPITSDEEYLSPLEEGMDFGGPEPRRLIDTRFKEPPAFLVPMSDQAVAEGQEVTLSVRISGQPKPMLYWLRDRVTVKTGPRHVVREAEEGAFDMTIRAAVRADSGVYTCKIINEYGTKQCQGRLDVKVPPVEPGLAVVRPIKDITARAGETVLLECHVLGPADTDVDWLSDGRLVQPALLNCKMHFDGKKCRLLLNSVHEDDSGTYTCKLSTAKEEITSCGKLRVVPSIEPLFTRMLDVLEVIEGRNARFDCKVSGTPPPKVTWSHFDHPLVGSEDVHILKEGGRHSLIISHVTNEDEGFYTVTACNNNGEAESSAELYVQEPRPAISSQMAKLEKMPSIPEEPEVPENEVERFTMPDFVKPLYDLDVIEGKEAVLKCKVAGLPYPTIVWFHNGKRIESTEDRRMTQYRDVHSLVIRSVCHGHGGVYKSVISNKVGKATCYAHLYVTDILPDPPDGAPQVDSISGKTITLSWKKPRRLDPSIDPSSLMYAIQQQALGSIQWTIIASSLRETTYTISTLSKGVRFAFRILTITSKAFSKPSPATEPVQLLDRGPYLQEAPVIVDKPDMVYVMENQSVTITVTLNHVNATITWKRRGVVLSNRPGLYEMTMPDDDQHNLTLLKVRSADVGPMACTASNKQGSDSCSFSIEMAAPPTFEIIMEDLDVGAGETPRFAVVVEGKPVPDILWFKNDSLLSESSHYTFVYDDNECSLVILNTRPEDSGVYTCTARNLAGSVSCKAELTVHQAKCRQDPIEDEASKLRRMRRLTDYYDIHKEIGRGAFCYVKRVSQKVGKMDYAAKFISARSKKKASALREMNLLSKLDHERILYFHDAFEKKNAVIVVTEICNEEMLDRFTKRSTLMESDVRSCMRQLLEGVDYLHHQNVLHLDIKPDNILMADPHGDQIRICDFGNAVEIIPGDDQYCKYGTPEFVAPEIVNQSPVSKATDIWPVGVIAYLCLTGVSPFAGENDRSSVLNIRNYNVAFEENMFSELCREAKGFIIKVLVADRLRPDSQECLRHPWFKTLTKGKAISTDALKKFVARRKWQRSLIGYKSKMVLRSIPELLNDSSSHISIAVPKHQKEGSPLPPSSSSDSDEDLAELPFIPMPLTVEFSGSRVSLTDIQSVDDTEPPGGKQNGTSSPSGHIVQEATTTTTSSDPAGGGDKDQGVVVDSSSSAARRGGKKSSQENNDKGSSDEEQPPPALPQRSEISRRPLRRGSSVESDHAEPRPRRGELRRGGSADSALALRITPEEGEGGGAGGEEVHKKVLKKAVSMELPRRSASPGGGGGGAMSQEDYALKLEQMRQRLLRGSAVDKKMSGLRGPLLETLGDEKQRSSSLERHTRGQRLGPPPPLTRAATCDSSSSSRERDDALAPKPKVLRKSASFSQGDAEPMPLHRRCGAPLEIPLAQIEERRLKEAISMSSLTEQVRLDSRPVTPCREPSPKPPTPPESIREESPTKMECEEEEESVAEREVKMTDEKMEGVTTDSNFDERSSTSGFSEKDMSISEEPMMESEDTPAPPQRGETLGGDQEDKMEEERDEAMEDVEDETTKPKEDEDQEMVEEEVRRSTPVRASEMVISTTSVRVTPTQEHPKPSAAAAAPPPAPLVLPEPARVVLPDGRTSAYASIMQTMQPLGPSTPVAVPTAAQTYAPPPAPAGAPSSAFPGPSKPVVAEHAAVYSRVASPEMMTKEPSPPPPPPPPREASAGPGGDFQDITSEEVFEARFKKRESSLTRSLRRLPWSKNEEKTSSDATESPEEMYRPGPMGAPLEIAQRNLMEKSKSVQDLREAQKDQGFMKRLSMRLRRAPSTPDIKEEKPKEEEPAASSRRLSWTLGGRKGSQEKKDTTEASTPVDASVADAAAEQQDDLKKPDESPVLAIRRKIESTVAGISSRIRSYSEERRTTSEENKEQKKTPILSMLRRSMSENRGMKVPQNQLAAQTTTNGASSESLDSMSSLKSDSSKGGPEVERRSRWDRWGLTRGGKTRDKTISQPDLPSAIARDPSLRSRIYSKLASDFPPVFHIKLRDHVLLEGDPVTLSCLPAGSPHPHINWLKDKRPMEIDARMNMISCPDGRQLLMIMQTTKKDAGLYECVATNPLAAVSSSCTISLARLPNRPGTPEVPQRYQNTALVLWRPSDTMAPCTYSLERKAEAEPNWLIVATGVADCYYNVVDLPAGGGAFRFRVACVNKAGQGPYSNLSEAVCLDTAEPAKSSATVVVKTAPSTAPVQPAPKTAPSTAPVQPKTTASTAPAPVQPKTTTSTAPVQPKTTASTAPAPVQPKTTASTAPVQPKTTASTAPVQPKTTASTAPAPVQPKTAPSTAPAPVQPKTAPSTAPVQPKTAPSTAPVQPVMKSSMTIPSIKASPSKPTASPAAPAASTHPANAAAAPSGATSGPPSSSSSSSPPPPPPAAVQATPAKAKTTLSINMSKPQVKLAVPPVVPPKPKSPVTTKAPPGPAPATIGKPISSVPTYAPTAASRVTPPTTQATPPPTAAPPPAPAAPSPAAAPPPVVLVSSLTPVAATPSGRVTPSGRATPTGRRTPLGSLRQGVPQKPYTFMDEKARGRFGVIRECRENATGNLFMAKIVPYEGDNKPTVLQEYDILKSLHHEKIMALHEAYVTPRYLVLISECCSGKEILYSLIDRFRYSEDDVVSYIIQVLQGLDYLHNRRILHLDIKPDNIIVTYMNVVKIIDFGTAQTFNPLFLKQFSPAIGTLDYMSPEMLKGDVVGPPADIWSVGVLTFIMLSGRSPFTDNDPQETESRILAAKFDLSKMYQNVSQSASLFLKKILCSYPWARPTVKDCYNNSWLQDAYLMRLRRQTLTFTTTRLKEFLAEQQQRRELEATSHKVLLRSYQSSPHTPTSPTSPVPFPPTSPVSFVAQ